jgi:hypothetical protein
MTRPRAPHVEAEHRQAFELYASLGERRTYRRVASQLAVSERTVRHWAKQEKWRQRLEEREDQAARQLSDRSIQSTFNERDRDLKIVRMAKMKLTRDIAEGKVKGKLPDLEMLIRLEAELLGGNGDPLLALIQQLPEEVRDPVMECLRRRLTAFVAALQSTQGEKRGEAANPTGSVGAQ